MSNQRSAVGKQKKTIILLLYLGTLIIMFLGAFFGAYSYLNDIKIQVLSAKVPGLIFGLLVVYLGLRYFFMVDEFKANFYESSAKFSWSNFRSEKKKRKISETTKIKLITGR